MKNFMIAACLTHIEDKNTGLHSLVNMIENGVVTETPSTLPGFAIYTKWSDLTEGSLLITVLCKRPSGDVSVICPQEEFNCNAYFFTMINYVAELKIFEEGVHLIFIEIKTSRNEVVNSQEYPILIRKK